MSRGNGGGATAGFFPIVNVRWCALIVLEVVLPALVRNDNDPVDTDDDEDDMYDDAADGAVGF